MKLFGGAAKFASFTTSKNVQYTPVANGTKFGQSGVAYVKAADRIWVYDALYSINSEMHSECDSEYNHVRDYYDNSDYRQSLNDIAQGSPIPPMHKVMILNGSSIIWGKLVVRPTDPSNSECYTPLSVYVQYKIGNETFESIIHGDGSDNDEIYYNYGFTDYIVLNNTECPIITLVKTNTQFTATKSEYTLAQVMENSELYSEQYFVPEEFAGIFKFKDHETYANDGDYDYINDSYDRYTEFLDNCDPTKTVYIVD